MTREDGNGVNGLDLIPVARAIEMLWAWKAGVIDPERAVDILSRLPQPDVVALILAAERKLGRRNRDRLRKAGKVA